MPPKVRTTREDIISAALSIVRKSGIDTLNARTLANALNTSTQPIFSNFKNMEEVKEEVFKKALELYYERLKEREENESEKKMKARGLAYISFARDEEHLFRLIFLSKRDDHSFPMEESSRELELIREKTGLEEEDIKLMEEILFFLVHGIATNIVSKTVILPDSEIDKILDITFLSLWEKLSHDDNH